MADRIERGDDPTLDALEALLSAARENIVAWVNLMGRIDEIRDLRRTGVRYSDMLLTSESPSIIITVATNQERLTAAGAQFRRTAARQLYDEGRTVAEIARAFDVSRQRIDNLLHGDDPSTSAATSVAPPSDGETG